MCIALPVWSLPVTGASREFQVYPSDYSRGFERGATDTYSTTLPLLGDIKSITVSHKWVQEGTWLDPLTRSCFAFGGRGP
jgi:hypothetical protein